MIEPRVSQKSPQSSLTVTARPAPTKNPWLSIAVPDEVAGRAQSKRRGLFIEVSFRRVRQPGYFNMYAGEVTLRPYHSGAGFCYSVPRFVKTAPLKSHLLTP